MFEIRLLGQFEIRANGAAVALPSRPAQSLLARLALTPGMAHRREKLAGELWPDAHEANARSNLRHALWRIRRALACDETRSARDIIRTNNIGVSMIARADTHVDAISLAQAAQNIHLSTDALAAVAGLYQGELLPGFYDDWVSSDRIRLQVAFDGLMQRLMTQLSTEGRWRVMQCAYGSFHRVVPLPARVLADQARASYKNGVLRVELPKATPGKPRPVTIPVD